MDNSTIQRVKQRYGIVGNCEALNRAIEIALKIAPVDLSVLITGENGVGKTHIMKLAYAACKCSKHDVSFSQKTTMLFRPDQSSIGRLVNRNKNGFLLKKG